MSVQNADIAAVFNEIADLLEIEGENVFRIRAYRNAARIVGDLRRSVQLMVEKGGDLTSLPGIGTDLAAKITEVVITGDCALLARLRKALPPAITELLKMPGLGPKRVKALHDALNVQTIEQLYHAAKEGKIRDVPGFGLKTEQHILDTIEAHIDRTHRFKLAEAMQYAEPLQKYLAAVPGVDRVAIAGSFRRMCETVGDLDILVTTDTNSPVMQRFVEYEDVMEVLSSGPTRAGVLLRSGLQVDLRVVVPGSFGAALVYFTGSKAHNIALRRLAQDRGLKINEYGVFRGKERIAGGTEASVYEATGLQFIPPELREDRGELEAARTNRMPKLVRLADLRGDLHAHTKESDGRNTLREMAMAAKAKGLEYLAITEHSQRLAMARGLDPIRLAKHIDKIDRLNAELDGITLLKGIEVEILEDGNLDLPDSILARLDVVIGAVHSRFDLSRARQTERILRAMDHPYFNILAHPTGRLINEREPYDIDLLRVIRKAKACGCFLELNAQPQRLDLVDKYCQIAKAEGVLISIDSDAHSVFDFENLRFGIGQACRGWLEKDDVLNTRSLKELQPLLMRSQPQTLGWTESN
ncbi:MAG: DNA polymerase/3'-5' exonuclease PolX [Pseudomonadota bacterium]